MVKVIPFDFKNFGTSKNVFHILYGLLHFLNRLLHFCITSFTFLGEKVSPRRSWPLLQLQTIISTFQKCSLKSVAFLMQQFRTFVNVDIFITNLIDSLNRNGTANEKMLTDESATKHTTQGGNYMLAIKCVYHIFFEGVSALMNGQ